MTNSVSIDLFALEEDFCFSIGVYIVSLSKLFDITTQKAINCFQVQITNVVKYMDYICCCCSQFVD